MTQEWTRISSTLYWRVCKVPPDKQYLCKKGWCQVSPWHIDCYSREMLKQTNILLTYMAMLMNPQRTFFPHIQPLLPLGQPRGAHFTYGNGTCFRILGRKISTVAEYNRQESTFLPLKSAGKKEEPISSLNYKGTKHTLALTRTFQSRDSM